VWCCGRSTGLLFGVVLWQKYWTAVWCGVVAEVLCFCLVWCCGRSTGLLFGVVLWQKYWTAVWCGVVAPIVKDIRGRDVVYTWSVASNFIYVVYQHFYSCKLLLHTQFMRVKFMLTLHVSSQTSTSL
jgi:hypothetical protein